MRILPASVSVTDLILPNHGAFFFAVLKSAVLSRPFALGMESGGAAA